MWCPNRNFGLNITPNLTPAVLSGPWGTSSSRCGHTQEGGHSGGGTLRRGWELDSYWRSSSATQAMSTQRTYLCATQAMSPPPLSTQRCVALTMVMCAQACVTRQEYEECGGDYLKVYPCHAPQSAPMPCASKYKWREDDGRVASNSPSHSRSQYCYHGGQ